MPPLIFNQVAVTDVSTQVFSVNDVRQVTLRNNVQVHLRNTGTTSVFIGDSGVTTTNGFEINKGSQPGSSIVIQGYDEDIYAIAGTGLSSTLCYLVVASS